MKPNLFVRLFTGTFCALFILPAACAQSVTATYVGSTGNYSVPIDWSTGTVPLNGGGTIYDVENSVLVYVDVNGTVNSVDGSGQFSITDHTFAVTGAFGLYGAFVIAQDTDASLTVGPLKPYSPVTKALGAVCDSPAYTVTAALGRSATFAFTGADIVTNYGTIGLDGAGARMTDENGQDALRHFAVSKGVLDIENRSFTTAGDFQNDGYFLIGIENGFGNSRVTVQGNLLNFTKSNGTLNGGRYEMGSGTASNPLASTFQFNDADIVTNAAEIRLQGPRCQIIDQFGNNALRHFSHNAPLGSFTIENASFTTAGDFTNDGILQAEAFPVGGTTPQPTFAISGNLTNYAAGTLTGGTYAVTGGRIQIPNADIVHNAATILMQTAGPALIDQNGQDALRHFAHNTSAGEFKINGVAFATAGDFTNDGLLSILSPFVFPPPINNSPSGQMTINGNLSNSGRLALGEDFVDLSSPIISVGGRAALLHLVGGNVTTSGNVLIAKGSTLSIDGAASYVQAAGMTDLETGTISAGTVLIQGGALVGHGTINADVTNSGRIEPNSTDTRIDKPGGTIAIGGRLTLTSSSHTSATRPLFPAPMDR